MCTEETIKKLDSGKYVAVPKWEHWIKLWTPIVAIIIFLVSMIRWYDDVNARMFDSQKQKYEVFAELRYDSANTLKPREKAEIFNHIHNTDLHMSKKMKDEQYVPRKELTEMTKNLKNQIKTIQSDVSWIKRYLINKK